VRDYSVGELEVIQNNNGRVITFFDADIKTRQFEGDTWKKIVDEIISGLPQNIYVSFDIDGLDPKLCPNTGTPVHGGFEIEEIFYLLSKMLQSGRRLIGFDLLEVAMGDSSWDANVGARVLWKLCNLLVKSNPA
jgi:agmatinase